LPWFQSQPYSSRALFSGIIDRLNTIEEGSIFNVAKGSVFVWLECRQRDPAIMKKMAASKHPRIVVNELSPKVTDM
jgi:hypothetical protein